MPIWIIALLIGGICGLIFGTWIARGSAERQPIGGGSAGRLFHYLGCAAVTAAPFAGFSGGLLANGLHFFPRLLLTSALGFGCIGLAALFLIVYAALEAGETGAGNL